MARGTETPLMELLTIRLQDKIQMNLEQYLRDRRNPKRPGGAMGWDPIMFELFELTGRRVVRESVRTWARDRYGIPEPEHDYGVRAEDMPG